MGELDGGEFFAQAVGFATPEPRQRFVEMLAALTDEAPFDLLDPGRRARRRVALPPG